VEETKNKLEEGRTNLKGFPVEEQKCFFFEKIYSITSFEKGVKCRKWNSS
jgi:hypothetical protein